MQTSVFGFLWKYLSRLKYLFFGVLLLVFLGEFSTRLSLYFGAEIVNVLSAGSPSREAFSQALVFAGLAALFAFGQGLLINAMIFLEAKYMPIFISRMSKDLFAYAHNHSTAFFAEEMAGNISGKIKSIIDSSHGIYYQILWGGISPLIALGTTFFFIWNVNVELALILSLIHI